MPDVCPIGTQIQTVLVPHAKFPSRDSARAWVVEHGFRATKVDEGRTVTRFRQIDPDHFEPKSFRTIPLGASGVQAVIGCPRQSERSEGGSRSGSGSRAESESTGDAELRERVKSLVGKRK